MLRLYLVRHGVTTWNAEGRVQGHTDIPLSEEGMEQARHVAERLAGERIDAVWSSDLSRARMTAEAIARPHNLTVVATPLLRERMHGGWEGLTEAEIIARGDEGLLRAYRADSIVNDPPGAETLAEVWARLLCAEEEVRRAHPEGTVVIVGHGGSLRAILCHALEAPIAGMRRIWLDNVSLSLIEFSDSRVWVRLMNDTSHIS